MTGRLGEATPRTDAAAKARGAFAFAGDLSAPGMLWAAVARSPHPHARLVSLDTAPARRVRGVLDVITAADVPGRATFGLKIADQPVFAGDVCRFYGEPVAAVAATSRDLARQAAAAIQATWEPLPALTDPQQSAEAGPIHPDGNVFARLQVATGDPEPEGPVVVEGSYQLGVQDQAFLGTEAGLAIPDPDGGVSLHVATQSVHADRDQLAACLGLPANLVRVRLAGVGGAFGGREDLTVHVPACLLALRTGRAVKLVYDRVESFLGHVHRHPVIAHYRHTADRDGRLVSVRARFVLDGGAYASTSPSVLNNTVTTAAGPYRVPNADLHGMVVRTNNPPSGAMRGFGAVQSCIGYEAQMDALAAAVGLDPVELRRRNVLGPGDRLPTGQVVDGSAPVREVLDTIASRPLPGDAPGGDRIRRGVGIALGFKSVIYTAGHNVPATALVRAELGTDGQPRAVIVSSAAEVGQGFVTIAQQLVRTELGVDQVVLEPASSSQPPAGATSASRQTWMSGGALQLACRAILDKAGGSPLAEALRAGPIEAERTYMHVPTQRLDERGQGRAHVAWAFVAHRAVVDVDIDLGTVRLVDLATAQDVGAALNPLALLGQLEGGTAQGAGLALMEEMVIEDGYVQTVDLADYLVPTAVDLPTVSADLVEVPEPAAPYGAKGAGEAPSITSTAAVAAALRDATGQPVTRLPARPADLVENLYYSSAPPRITFRSQPGARKQRAR
jgi:CO/xanthine dehydrogenase Mo-binding subunit